MGKTGQFVGSTGSGNGALASILIISSLAAAALINGLAPGSFEQLSQEDGPIEWLSFYAFAGAALLAVRALFTAGGKQQVWLSLYMSLFALGSALIAGEEISWGQRVLGYQPPEAFLAENFQQELNVHNLAADGVRQAVLLALLAGFGVLFPLLRYFPGLGPWLAERVPVPGAWIIPGFLALIAVYLTYPWSYSGEWVELGLGLGLLLTAAGYGNDVPSRTGLGAVAIALGLALLTPWALTRAGQEVDLEQAQLEVEALAEDLRTRHYRSRCGVHKRFYTFTQDYGGRTEGSAFHALEHLDPTRRDYYLDPWNQPYWLRHRCSKDRQDAVLFVYSFGPNRRRDSTAEQLGGDDVGVRINFPRSR
ncbi:MAG: hypothetical protein AAGE43_05765 [Pseudomonadota bacterium]